MRRTALAAAGGLLVCVGAALAGRGAWLEAKAALAGVLVRQAMARTLADGQPHAPWGWADFQTLAVLEVPRLGLREPVLSGATGPTLAFGIGHVDGSARPGLPGNVVLAGHRDRQMAFLGRLSAGDRIDLRTVHGVRSYQVRARMVVDEAATELLRPDAGDRLVLLSCYPLHGLTPTTWRVVVMAEPGLSGATRPPPRHAPPAPARAGPRPAPGGGAPAAGRGSGRRTG